MDGDNRDEANDSKTNYKTNTNKMSGIKAPKPLIVNNDIDMSQERTEWLELYEYYAIVNKLDTETTAIQIANFKACLGRDGLKVLNNIGLTAVETSVLKAHKDKLTVYFAPSKNKTYERCQFHRIKQ